jgi:hypothetical protein
MPNFLILGAAKAGTSSLFRYLEQHPDVFMSAVKEPKFFSFEGRKVEYGGPGDVETNRQVVTRREDYEALFSGAAGRAAVGEASTLYLYDPEAPARVRRHVPGARLLAVLRDPVERAYSAYLHLRRDGREPLDDFAAALAEEPRRRGWDLLWQYAGAGLYHEQIARYDREFPRDRILVLLHEDFRKDPIAMVRRVFEYLGVDPGFRPDVSREHNQSLLPRSRTLHRILTAPNAVKRALRPFVPLGIRRGVVEGLKARNLQKPEMPVGIRERLVGVFREDVLRLQDRIGIDLSAWLRA